MQNTIYGGDGGEALETQQTITNGGRAKVAGASRLRTSDKWPRLPVAPRALPGAFRPKRPEVSREETRERNAEDDPVRVPVSPSRVTGPEPTAPDPASRTVHDRLSSRSTVVKLNTPSETRSLRKKKTKTTRRLRRPRRGVAVRHRVGCAAAAVRGFPPPAQEQKLQVRRGDREGGRRRVRRAEVQVRLRDRASRGGADEGEAVGGRGFVSVARLASVDVQTRDERNVATRRVWTASCTCASGSDETTA